MVNKDNIRTYVHIYIYVHSTPLNWSKWSGTEVARLNGVYYVIKNLKLQTVPPPICLNLKSECLITLNNRWKQLSSINLNFFDVSSSPNYVDIIIVWSNR